MTLFLVFPFTRLVHVWSAPVWYLGRRGYQVVRSRDGPSLVHSNRRSKPWIARSRNALPKPKTIRVNGAVIAREVIAREVQNHPAEKPILAWQAAARALVVRELLLQESGVSASKPSRCATLKAAGDRRKKRQCAH